MKYFRKSALVFILVVALLAAAWTYILRNGLIQSTARTALERMFEAPVEIKGLVFNPFTLEAGFERLRVANADHPDRWLIEAGPAKFDVNLLQLFAKKLVIRDVSLEHVNLGTERPEGVGVAPRPKPVPPPPPPPPPPAAKGAAGKKGGAAAPPEEEGGMLSDLEGLVPPMDFSGLKDEFSVDTLMKGRKLTAVDAVDNAKQVAMGKVSAWQQKLSGTTVPQDLRNVERDAQALRFNVKNLDDLKTLQKDLTGLKQRLDTSQKELGQMTGGWKADQKDIKAAWDKVGDATQEDLKTLRAAAKLPQLDATQVAKSVFGAAAVEQFNTMLGYARVAQRALHSDSAKPDAVPRRAGRWIDFPVTARIYPGFALQRSAFSGELVDKKGGQDTIFDGKMLGLSSNQKLYGAPLTITWDGKTKDGRHWTADAGFDQREAPNKLNIVIRGTGISLGTINLGGKQDGMLPLAVQMPTADVELSFKLTGGALGGGISVVAKKVTFLFPPGTPPKGSTAEAVRGVFTDFPSANLSGTLSGTLGKPKFDLKTSIDDILSSRLKAIVGKRVAEIEKQIRAAVEGPVNAARAQAEAQVAAQQAKLEQALGDMQGRSTQVQQLVDQRSKQAQDQVKAGETQAKKEADAAAKKATDKAKKDAESGAKKALQDKAKDLKLPKR